MSAQDRPKMGEIANTQDEVSQDALQPKRSSGAERLGPSAVIGVSAHPAVERAKRIGIPLVALALLVAAWHLSVVSGLVPNYMLPTPPQVVQALVNDWQLLLSHTQTTLLEAAAGLGLGVALGFVVAVAMDRFETLNLALQPLVTVSQTIPTIAIAPLLVLWLGYGMLPKIVLIVLTTFFPITISLVAGFKSVDPDVVDLMRTMNATRWQIFWYAKLPAAAGQFFSGLKISATYAIVGAVIAEWLGGNAGLGVYMTRVRKSFSYDRMFAVIIVISGLSLLLMKLVDLLQVLCMPWGRKNGD